MRFLLGLIILLSFNFNADEKDGLPELATEEQKRELQTRRAKVLTASTARRVQSIVEGLDEAGQLEEAKTLLLKDKKTAEANLKDKQIDSVIKETESELAQLRNRVSSLNSYDRSMFYYYQAYVNLAYKDNLVAARNDYLNLIKEQDAQPRIKLSAYYTVAQLYLSDEDFDNGIKYLKLWFKTTDEVTAQAYVLLGQAYFLQDQFQKAYNVMMEAKRISDETGTTFRENWYSILLATMGELNLKREQVPYYEEVLELYPKKRYFVNLAGLYNELDRSRDYTSLLKTAYQKELLDKSTEFQSLSQMLLAAGNPYWAAEVILTGMTSVAGIKVIDQECALGKVLDVDGNLVVDNDGIPVEEMICEDVLGPAFVKPGSAEALDKNAAPILDESERNLTILAESLRAAQEREAAIDVYERLDKVISNGEAQIAIGNLYYLDNDISKAIEAINKGIKKGSLKNPGFAQLTLGQALFELQRFDEARDVFTKASQSEKDSVKKSARAWLQYTDNEQERVRNLNLRRESIS
ncbi:MAG: hypothetical protein O3C54_01090 [Proteobacteria bacterium]|nr:hypothetical protein [SAR86 cluster bacterium]MDA0344537.1 hypothetical protein [Pseudomonadota bacterium]MDA0899938.1 hypothetical protein [Pseudomonadota bacterium]MDA1056407.1 hypothetical protein [Pseudomonadota bacterium]